MIDVYLDSHIAIPGLSSKWIKGLSRLVSVSNEQKQVAQKEYVWGADKLDDFLTLADLDEQYLYLPRGFLSELINLLDESGYDYTIHDQTTSNYWDDPELTRFGKTPKFSEEQTQAIFTLLNSDQGRIIMPPGRGKTIIGLSAISHSGLNTLIITQQKHIAQQWVDRAKEHFDMDIGFIGDNKWEEKDISVALIQTLWSRRKELDHSSDGNMGEGWWNKWGQVILDEQHHIPAETFIEILQKFPATKRFGFSATIGKTEADKKISELVFGPILYESNEVNIKPSVEVIDTDFEYEYTATQKITDPHTGKKKIQRNNYKDIVKDLISNESRNDLIAKQVLSNSSGCHLIVSDRLNHLNKIESKIEYYMRTYRLTGKESLDERMEVYEKADEGDCAIFSTVASEALDIPRIDIVHLAYPRSNVESVWQIIGRATRTHPDKNSATIIDYRDKNCSVLLNQFRKRLQLYQQKQLEVNIPSQ